MALHMSSLLSHEHFAIQAPGSVGGATDRGVQDLWPGLWISKKPEV